MLLYIVFLLLSLTDALIEYHEDVTWELQTSEPPNCQHYPSKAELQGHVDSIYGLVIGEVTSGLPPDMSVSSTECGAYASASSLTWGGVMDTGVADPQGCYYNGNAIYYNTRADSTKECVSPYNCLQKVPAKPVRTISDATLPHGALYRPLFYESVSGSPDGSVSQAECGSSGSHTWNGYPIGCFLNSDTLYYNLASTTTECSASNKCIQKNPVTYYEKSSGSPDLSMSESECQVYAGSASFSSGSWGTSPIGCYKSSGGLFYYNNHATSTASCGVSGMNCIEKDIPFVFNVPPMLLEEVTSGAPDMSVSEAECSDQAILVSGAGVSFTASTWNTYPSGCQRLKPVSYTHLTLPTKRIV